MNRLGSRATVDHIGMERLEEVANGGMKASPFTEIEWEHFRHCVSCVERFREFVQTVVRSKNTKTPR